MFGLTTPLLKGTWQPKLNPSSGGGVQNLMAVSCAETHGSDHAAGEAVLSKKWHIHEAGKKETNC